MGTKGAGRKVVIDEEVKRRKALREGVGGDIWRGTRAFKRIIYFNSTFLSLTLHTREQHLLTVNVLGSNNRFVGH